MNFKTVLFSLMIAAVASCSALNATVMLTPEQMEMVERAKQERENKRIAQRRSQEEKWRKVCELDVPARIASYQKKTKAEKEAAIQSVFAQELGITWSMVWQASLIVGDWLLFIATAISPNQVLRFINGVGRFLLPLQTRDFLGLGIKNFPRLFSSPALGGTNLAAFTRYFPRIVMTLFSYSCLFANLYPSHPLLKIFMWLIILPISGIPYFLIGVVDPGDGDVEHARLKLYRLTGLLNLILYAWNKREAMVQVFNFFVKGEYTGPKLKYLVKYALLQYEGIQFPEDYKNAFFSRLAMLVTVPDATKKQQYKQDLDHLLILGQLYQGQKTRRFNWDKVRDLAGHYIPPIKDMIETQLASQSMGVPGPMHLISGRSGIGKSYLFQEVIPSIKDTEGSGLRILFLKFEGNTIEDIFGTPPDAEGKGGKIGSLPQQIISFTKAYGAPDIIVLDEILKKLLDPSMGKKLATMFLKTLEQPYPSFFFGYFNIEITLPVSTVLLANVEEQEEVPFMKHLRSRLLVVTLPDMLTPTAHRKLMQQFQKQACQEYGLDEESLMPADWQDFIEIQEQAIEKGEDLRQTKMKIRAKALRLCASLHERARQETDADHNQQQVAAA